MRAVIHSGFAGGRLSAPPSKSMAHRALLCAALADGDSCITGIAPSEDMRATMRAMNSLGAVIVYDEATHTARVRGAMTAGKREGVPDEATFVDTGAIATCPPMSVVQEAGTLGCTGSLPVGACVPLFPPVCGPVDCGESGSTLRFVIPLFSLTNAPVTFVGHGRLPSRPQGVYAGLFTARGLHFAQDACGVSLCGALTAGEYYIDGSVSSQFISGLLFALPLVKGDSILHITPPFESRSYVELTLQVLCDFGVQARWLGENTICIIGQQKYKSCDCAVEGDCSQAAFFAVLTACLPQSLRTAVTIGNLRADTRQGDRVIFDILKRCGAYLVQKADGSVTVHPSREALKGVEIDLADCPDLGPVLMVLGLFCAGKTVICNAGRLRVKESDRIAAMEEEIHKLGGEIHSEGDTVVVLGAQRNNTNEECSAAHAALHPSTALDGHGDHRIVMALAVATVAAGFAAPCEIGGAQAVRKSYPTFFKDLESLGGQIEISEI